MCLATVAKIEKILSPDHALLDFNGIKKKINLSLIKNPQEKEWVMVHAGFAIEKIKKEDAQKIHQLLNQ